jgi:hypothetical protein
MKTELERNLEEFTEWVKENERPSRKFDWLVGFAKTLFWLTIAGYIVCVAIDHNQLREMKKQALKLEIELLELQLGK